MPERPALRVQSRGGIGGRLRVPGDKSISHRALILGAVANGDTRVRGFLESADCLATAQAMRALGVNIERTAPAEIRVCGVGLRGLSAPSRVLDLGNSGTAMRLLTGLLAAQDFDSALTGDESLRRRPMERVAAPLRDMGAAVTTTDGRPPVRIEGGRHLVGRRHRLPIASAQVKSALLIAGVYAEGTTCVEEPAPSRDHTERLLRRFGCPVEADAAGVCVGGGHVLAARDVNVPGDFSSAAFFLVAAVVAGRTPLVVEGVGMNRTRTGLLDVLGRMGATIEILDLHDSGGEPIADLRAHPACLRGTAVPAKLVPSMIDDLPAFLIAAACAAGPTQVTGAGELRHKESDRLAAMAAGLRALGCGVTEIPDGLQLEGGGIRGGRVDAQGDHRVAMAFAVAGAAARAPVEIVDVARIDTSYPGFVADARELGMDVRELRV